MIANDAQLHFGHRSDNTVWTNYDHDLIIYCFTVETDWETWLAHKERLAISIKEIVENAGASFAFPSVSIYQEVHVPEIAAVPPADITADKDKI